jgi:hypothetical protein
VAGGPYSYLRQSSWKSQPSCLQHQLRWPQLPLNHRPRPRHPERLCRHRRRNTNANSATELSVAANIEVGTNGRVSQIIFFVVAWGSPSKVGLRGTVRQVVQPANLHFRRHQRETLSMHEMSKHLRSSRPSPTPRQDRPCKRSGNTSSVRRKKAWRD